MIDRIKGPQVKEITISTFPEFEQIRLSNGMELYILNAGTQNIFKLDLVFHGGRRYESKSGVARMCASIIREGIKGMNSEELSEYWDFYGAIIGSYSDLDSSGVSLTSLNKHSTELLPNFVKIINEASFPEDEIENKKKIFADKLKRELSKNDVIGYRELTAHIYGSEHIYGYNTIPEDYAKITREDQIKHFENYWGAGRGYAILSGQIPASLKDEVIKHISSIRQAKLAYEKTEVFPMEDFDQVTIQKISTSNKMQAAVKIGAVTIHRLNPDYSVFYLLVQILGGYFGSRLMKNLREEKGLCYNIYASIDRLKSSNYFYISADVDRNKLDLSLKEIRNEIEDLKTTLVSDDELTMVKNYINGKILAGLDGPFRSSQLLKNYLSYELDFDQFRDFNDRISKATPEQLMAVAKKYLDMDKMTQVIVGP